MTLKQIKFNPFKHWEIISNLYKQSFTKEERIPFFGLWLLSLRKTTLHCALVSFVNQVGVDFAVMRQTGQLVPFDYQDIFDSFSFGLGDVSIRPINQQNIPYPNCTELKLLSN